jgi:HEAT repeat protein
VAGTLAPRATHAFTLGVFDADILEERIMRLTRHARRVPLRRARILALASFSAFCLTCLAVSTFSFDLRPAGTRDGTTDGAVTTGGAPDFIAQEARKEAPARGGRRGADAERGGDEQARGEIESGLRSEDAQARAQAACLAGRAQAVELIPALVSMLGDDAAIEPVRCWESGRWSPALDTFKQPAPGEQAAIALASFGKPALGALKDSLADPRPSVRRNAAWAIGELTNMPSGARAGAVEPLVGLLGDQDEWVRAASARALGEIRDGSATDPLVGALSDGQARVRELAAWALGEMKSARAVEALCGMLERDAQGGVRRMAAWALGEIQSRGAVASLRLALGDSEPRVRETAKWALSEIEGDDD